MLLIGSLGDITSIYFLFGCVKCFLNISRVFDMYKRVSVVCRRRFIESFWCWGSLTLGLSDADWGWEAIPCVLQGALLAELGVLLQPVVHSLEH